MFDLNNKLTAVYTSVSISFSSWYYLVMIRQQMSEEGYMDFNVSFTMVVTLSVFLSSGVTMPLMKNTVNLLQGVNKGLNRLMILLIIYLPLLLISNIIGDNNFWIYIFPIIFLMRDFCLRIIYVSENTNIVMPTIVVLSTLLIVHFANSRELNISLIFGVYSLIMIIQVLISLIYIGKLFASFQPKFTYRLLDYEGINNWTLNASKNVFIMLALDGLDGTLNSGRIVYWINFLSPIKQVIPLSINLLGHKQGTRSLFRVLMLIGWIFGSLSLGLMLINSSFIRGMALTFFDLSMILMYFLIFKDRGRQHKSLVLLSSILVIGLSYLFYLDKGVMVFNHLIITLVLLLISPLIMFVRNEDR